jgi:hypothetical protein
LFCWSRRPGAASEPRAPDGDLFLIGDAGTNSRRSIETLFRPLLAVLFFFFPELSAAPGTFNQLPATLLLIAPAGRADEVAD